MAEFILETYKKCKIADIGGGKGLLAFLLNKKGWECVVIDPFDQILEHKYKDLDSGKRVKLTGEEITGVRRISSNFEKSMARDFDLLVGLHAQGSNI